MRRAGWRAESTCGLHVHVNKNSFADGGINRLCRFVYNPDHLEAMYKIAGRRENSYARLEDIEAEKALNGHAGRYVALNCDTGKGTVEFRLFASTTRGEKLLTRLEFVQSVCEFADTETDADRMELNAYCEYLADNADRFPLIFEFCGDVQATYNATAVDRADRARLRAEAARIEAERQAERDRLYRERQAQREAEREAARIAEIQANAEDSRLLLARIGTPGHLDGLSWNELCQTAQSLRRVLGLSGSCDCEACVVHRMYRAGVLSYEDGAPYGSAVQMAAIKVWIGQLAEQVRTALPVQVADNADAARFGAAFAQAF